MLKHANISVFVPHNGCPHMCSFCDQVKITGTNRQPNEEDIEIAVNNSKKTKNDNLYREIAFFGGSFTAINRDYMEKLLSCACKYVQSGNVNGIRISTRPDCIDEEILQILKHYKVTSIELGAQSMVDGVLWSNNRGHSSDDVRRASKLIKDYGFNLGLQMMTGLYMSSIDDDIYTAKEFIKLHPDTVRVYPTLIMKDTKLQELYMTGKYIPMTLQHAVDLCAKLLKLFDENKINVIRLGLHSSDGIHENFVAGPWHPAFRELCESKIILDKCIDEIKNLGYENKTIQIFVSPKDVSKIIGQKKSGIRKIKEICNQVLVKQDSDLQQGRFVIKELKNL